MNKEAIVCAGCGVSLDTSRVPKPNIIVCPDCHAEEKLVPRSPATRNRAALWSILLSPMGIPGLALGVIAMLRAEGRDIQGESMRRPGVVLASAGIATSSIATFLIIFAIMGKVYMHRKADKTLEKLPHFRLPRLNWPAYWSPHAREDDDAGNFGIDFTPALAIKTDENIRVLLVSEMRLNRRQITGDIARHFQLQGCNTESRIAPFELLTQTVPVSIVSWRNQKTGHSGRVYSTNINLERGMLCIDIATNDAGILNDEAIRSFLCSFHE